MWPVLVVGVIALLWRLAYLQRLAQTPLSGTLRGDEQSYWTWATFLLDHGLRGTNPFFQGPLYPYALALIRAPFRWTQEHVLVVQAIWGAAGVSLLTDAMRRHAGSRIALGVGAVLAVNAGWVFFDGLVLSESLLLFLEALLLWSWSLMATSRRRTVFEVSAGLVIGLLAQGRATAALLLVPHTIAVVTLARGRGSAGFARACLAIALFGITVLPSTLWNYSRTHAFMPFTYNGGLNLYVGNNPRADGTYSWIGGVRRLGTAAAGAPDGGVEFDGREYLAKARGLSLGPSESSTYWTGQAIAYARAHPGVTIRRCAFKLLLMLNHEEVPQIEHRSMFEKLAGPVGLPLFGGFGLLAWCGLLGLLVAHRSAIMGHLLRGYVLCALVSIVPFFVTDRYRIHLVPALAVSAALGIAATLAALRARIRVAPWALLLSGAVVAALVWMPLGVVDRDYDAWLGESDLGVRWLEAGDANRAVATFEHAAVAMRRLPTDLVDDPDVRHAGARLLFNYGVALRRVGREDDALPLWVEAATLDPTSAHYVRTLSDALRLRGRMREADSLLVRVRSLVGGDAEALLSEGFGAAREGRLDEARDKLERAVDLDGRLYGAWGALIRIHVLRDDIASGRATLARAKSAGMPPIAASLYEGLLAAADGDTTAAARELARTRNVDLDPTLEYVRRWTRRTIRSK